MTCTAPYALVNDIVATLTTADIAHSKSALLTLHFLFPHELLPALDLLDRQLVTQLIIPGNVGGLLQNEVYYVQSASATASRPFKTSRHQFTTPTSYEVRLAAWNCMCPAFAYSAFGKSLDTDLDLEEPASDQVYEHQNGEHSRARLGGVLTRLDAGVPICKHILAAFLGSGAPALFGTSVRVKEVDGIEVAGWAGGWGD